jgi:hypothetical protein
MGQTNSIHNDYQELKFERYIDKNLLSDRLSNFKFIKVDELDPVLIRAKMLCDSYFAGSCLKPNYVFDSVNVMVDYYLNHQDVEIYKQTKYLCNITTNICIYNINANAIVNLFNDEDMEDVIYVSWGNDI